ncbi:hypothetical protein [Burkholderia vietnamiensis]|uniref:hypothetical protein n=1 Tax=Burkholderia vietnamiensis TaxID=60552 RepID=UPI00158BA9B5|nr:hypothetical protein [Burkholderia vietnamiensis]
MSLSMVKDFDESQEQQPVRYLPSDESVEKFKEKVASLSLSEDEAGVVSYFFGVVPVGAEIHKDQYEIGRQVGLNQNRVSMAIASLVSKEVITKSKKGKYNYYVFNLALEVPVKKAGVVIPFRKNKALSTRS